MDSTPDQEISLSRTTSNRSDTNSIYSSYSSAGSLSSVATNSSTASGRRMIIPLYNLQAHNVMTNVIVDAGTDAKIAKFLKRGLEIIGLAVLEPIETFGAAGYTAPPSVIGPARASIDSRRLSVPGNTSRPGTPERPQTPSSSNLSLSSTGHHAPAAPVEVATPPTGAKRLFGKIFRKKDSISAPAGTSVVPVLSPPVTPTTAMPTFMVDAQTTPTSSRHSKRASYTPAAGAAEPYLQPEILGIRPALHSPVTPPVGRPGQYVWVVRRWLKGANEGMLSGMMAQLDVRRREGSMIAQGQVELRFEWAKGKPKRARKEKLEGNGVGVGRRPSRSHTPSRRTSLAASSEAHSQTSLHDRRRSMDASAEAHRMSITDDPEEMEEEMEGTPRVSSMSHGHEEDEGDESDPEDSETPWTCTLVLRRGDGTGQVRTRVASLSPTPHHPKVVAMLKVPFPLPDVAVEQMSIVQRTLTPAGVARPMLERSGSSHGSGHAGGHQEELGLVVTAEEIKDVVSSTGMWLIVREGIGGVGKVTRKGDGWRIRG